MVDNRLQNKKAGIKSVNSEDPGKRNKLNLDFQQKKSEFCKIVLVARNKTFIINELIHKMQWKQTKQPATNSFIWNHLEMLNENEWSIFGISKKQLFQVLHRSSITNVVFIRSTFKPKPRYENVYYFLKLLKITTFWQGRVAGGILSLQQWEWSYFWLYQREAYLWWNRIPIEKFRELYQTVPTKLFMSRH